MSIRTYGDLKTNIGSTVRETQIGSLLGDFLNLTYLEICQAHTWTWLRRKQTFSTVASQEDYALDDEVDRISLVRQIETPHKLMYVPDHLFYKLIPDPESQGSGVPYFYRLWEETGFSTNLAAADTIYVVSSSASDVTQTIRIVGRDSSGEILSESISLNGTTNVTSTNTFGAAGLLQVSKSATTVGTVSVYRTTGATLLSEIAPDEITPRYKKISLYPIPSSVVTTYIEYFERPRLLSADSDTPQMDIKWLWVLREGALAKAWEYKQNETAAAMHQGMFANGLAMMKKQDMGHSDYIPVIEARFHNYSSVVRVTDSISDQFPSYALRF